VTLWLPENPIDTKNVIVVEKHKRQFIFLQVASEERTLHASATLHFPPTSSPPPATPTTVAFLHAHKPQQQHEVVRVDGIVLIDGPAAVPRWQLTSIPRT